jgi:hypothetical protein
MTTQTMNDNELRRNGIEALNKALGVSGAFRFLALLHREPTDYVKVSRRLYKRQTVDDIFSRAQKTRRKT